MNTHHNKMSMKNANAESAIYRAIYARAVNIIVAILCEHYEKYTGMNMSQEMRVELTNKTIEQFNSSLGICSLIEVENVKKTKRSNIAMYITNQYIDTCFSYQKILTYDDMTTEEIQLQKEKLERELGINVQLITYNERVQQITIVLNAISLQLSGYHEDLLELNPTYYQIKY